MCQLQSLKYRILIQVILVHFDTQPVSLIDIVYTIVQVTEFKVQNLEPGYFSSFWYPINFSTPMCQLQRLKCRI